jgi:polyhydroxyalkanoate synthesis repressor PhaR
MAGPKIVKRYANRKLYDTERSCYVTLDDISLMIKAGDEVRVVDNKTGEDLTSVTLAQIIFETEKKKSFMPLDLLRGLIQNKGESLGEVYREKLEKPVQQLRDTAQARVQEMRGRVEGVFKKGEKEVRGQLDSVQKAFDDLQKGVEERIKGGVGLVGRELEQLRTRLTELEERLGRHEPPPPQ